MGGTGTHPCNATPHLLSALRYIARNPVEAGLFPRPEDWPWSSYPTLIGVARPQSFVSTAWTLSLFARDRAAAVRLVRQSVDQVPGTWTRCARP